MEGKFGFDKNPLHQICAVGNQQKLESLIANGADLSVVIGDRESTLMHIAAEYGHVSILKTLLETKAVEHILRPDHEGDTPIHIATHNIDVFWVLYKKFASRHPKMHVDDKRLINNKGRTLLHYAAGKGALEVVKFLLGKTLLSYHPAEKGDLGTALLGNNANKFARDSYGATPFHFAARCGSVPVMKELVVGDDVDVENNKGRTALHYASWNGESDAVKWLLEKGASLAKTDANGDTALHWAARRKTPDVLYTLLMKPDADVFAVNKAGQSPISLALHNPKGAANAEIMKRIRSSMEKSSSLPLHRHSIYMAGSKDGAILLHYAVAYGEKEDVEWFFNQARMVTVRKIDGKNSNFVAIVNNKDNNGNNPFHWAAINGNSPVIEALRSYKVDPLAKNNECATPFLLALINNHLDFARNLGKCLGKSLSDPMFTEDIRTWTDTFIDECLIRAFKFHMRKFIFMPSGLQDKDIKMEMPFIYKVLYANKEEGTIKFIQELCNVNKAGKLTGRTALHWATILNQKEIVFKLCQRYSNHFVASFDFPGKEGKMPLVAFVADKEGKTPLDYAPEGEILRELMKRPGVKYYAHKHYKDMERYVSACNAILVSAALIVSVTFAGWLHPPKNDEHFDNYSRRHPALRMFWIFNGSSFFCAIATVVAAASALIPAPYEGLTDGEKSIRKSLNRAAAMLAFSIFFVFCAFAAASFVVLPRSYSYRQFLYAGIALGGLLFLWFICKSVHGLYKVHSLPSSAEGRPIKSEMLQIRSSSPQSDGGDGYEMGTRREYLPWDDGLDNDGDDGPASANNNSA